MQHLIYYQSGINNLDEDIIGKSFTQKDGKRKGQGKGPKCFNCGRYGHYADQCSLSSGEDAPAQEQQSTSSVNAGVGRAHWSQSS